VNTPPACYGSPVAVSNLCDTCRACRAASGCTQEALQFLESQPDSPLMQRERLRLAVVSQALVRSPDGAGAGQGAPTREGRLPITAEQRSSLAQLAAPIATMAKKLFERGWFDFARREMTLGRNPGMNDWQRTLCAHLIAGGVSRQGLQLAYQQNLGMTPGSARVRVSRAVCLFTVGGLVTEFDNRLQLRRN
jgi:hypothetical protein